MSDSPIDGNVYNMNVVSLPEILGQPAFRDYLDQCLEKPSDLSFISITIPVKAFDPLACLEIRGDQEQFQNYWEKPDRGLALAGGTELLRITAEGVDRFASVSRQVKELKKQVSTYSFIEHSLSGPHLLGGFSFFDSVDDDFWRPYGSASFTLPEWLLVRDGELGLLTLTIDLGSHPGRESIISRLENRLLEFERIFNLNPGDIIKPANRNATHSEFDLPTVDRGWIENIDWATSLIRDGEFKKIVIARDLEVNGSKELSPTLMLHHLRNRYPSCFSFMIRRDRTSSFIGCSPERLVSFKTGYLLTEGLAGSISRGGTASEDAYFEKRLVNSHKNRNEHRFVVDAIVKRLEPFVQRIEKSDIPAIRKLSNVQHLLTPITAWLKKEVNRFDILEQLHPTPAVGGFPRDEALPFIRRLELFDRGWYAGSIGWLNLTDGGEFTVAIRSGLIQNHEARFYAGCGIVADSDPETEWEESNLKLRPMLSALNYAQSDSTE